MRQINKMITGTKKSRKCHKTLRLVGHGVRGMGGSGERDALGNLVACLLTSLDGVEHGATLRHATGSMREQRTGQRVLRQRHTGAGYTQCSSRVKTHLGEVVASVGGVRRRELDDDHALNHTHTGTSQRLRLRARDGNAATASAPTPTYARAVANDETRTSAISCGKKYMSLTVVVPHRIISAAACTAPSVTN